MLKRIMIVIFIMIGVIFISNFSYAETPSIYIENVIKEENSDIVEVSLDLENVISNLSSLNFDIKYDKNKLEYIESKTGRNLKTTVQMSEYVEDGKISIRIISKDGLKNDGTYYKISFKILDDSIDKIPVNLDLKNAVDATGKDIKCNTNGGTIYTKDPGFPIENNKDNEVVEEKPDVIKPFDKTDVKPTDKLDDIVNSNSNVGDISKKDNFNYEVKNKDILEVLPDGTMVPKQDGTTEVLVKVDDQEVGTMDVEVQNGEIKRIASKGKEENKETALKENNNVKFSREKNKESVVENRKEMNPVVLIIMVVLFALIIIALYSRFKLSKTSRKKSKKIKKNS